ncbi:MAG: SDR family oxidoreductase [Rhodocyclaceae bacterium]|jgi:meso-butanediol dehydrogenase/(S,S)-butanediol dehydrogenase/diacetyl reductase|nr:SDR family oxidoreductase [Rhodocyclaceae bacterium]
MAKSEGRFNGKVAIVTGGTSGIGEALVRLLVAEGARVVIAARREELGNALVNDLGADRALFCKCDMGVRADIEALFSATVKAFGGLDILVNNAALSSFGATPDLDPATWHQVIAANLDAVFYTARAAIPLFRQRGGGNIVNVASISGLFGDYGFTAYNASKGGVINYTKCLAIDHARENIRVNVVCPGLVETPMSAVIGEMGLHDTWVDTIPMGRGGTPEEIAKIVAFVASDDASFMTGSVIVADGGLTAASGQPNLPKILAKMNQGG